MQTEIMTQSAAFKFDEKSGTVTSLRFLQDSDAMNWLIDGDTLTRYGYSDAVDCLLGKSLIEWENHQWDTRAETPTAHLDENTASFAYEREGLRLVHAFRGEAKGLRWRVTLQNNSARPVTLHTMYHWMPVHYVMHETQQENLVQSCAMVPCVSKDRSYVVCRKRSGLGPDLVVLNTGGGLRSVGSLCKYKNLFFEKSAPSLSGLVLFSAVNCMPAPADALVDWQYREAYEPVTLAPGECFSDEYLFVSAPKEGFAPTLLEHGYPVFDYEPVVLLGNPVSVNVRSESAPVSCVCRCVDEAGTVHETADVTLTSEADGWLLSIPAPEFCGEYELTVTFADGKRASVLYAVYRSMAEIVEAFCEGIYTRRFIDDPDDENYCAYRSVSRQGEACAKGSLLLLKNLLGEPDAEQIAQVEKNAALYLRRRWLDEDFRAIKQYPGGFARIIDLDYLILEFYLLSKCDNRWLRLNNADTYLQWAYRTARYRFTVTDDKLPREAVEVELASMISWLQLEMQQTLETRGFPDEAQELRALWKEHMEIQIRKSEDGSFIETEHYFDNAGISVCAEVLFRNGNTKEALRAANLLLANVAPCTDYRNFAPDRWWEAVAPMYHNLWAVFSAKALVTAYDATRDPRCLDAGYRAMMPMFYNYDWRAYSAPNRIQKGDGVSAYCLTSPNLNTAEASRNRFGQSIFKDAFFDQMDVSGDDWDLGADMVVYLYTFGQTAYVIEENGAWRGINARLEPLANGVRIISHAAYPKRYDVAPCKLSVWCETPGVLLRGIEVEDGICTRIFVQSEDNTAPEIHVTKDGTAQDRAPEICTAKG